MANDRRIPLHARAIFEALNFQSPCFDTLQSLRDADWRKLLDLGDRTQLLIPFGLRGRNFAPSWAASRIDRNLANNSERWERLKQVYTEAASAFGAAGLEFVVLKGFTHVPDFVCDPRLRAQYDLDLLFPQDQVRPALAAARQLGYEPLSSLDRRPVDHLPTLVRKTGWEWRGDYFDPEMPVSLELHFRLWDANTEGFDIQGTGEFWRRRRARALEGLSFAAFDSADALGYAASHALRHLLRGDLRVSHIYEVGCFLERQTDSLFWNAWGAAHDESLRRVEAICFAIAEKWFGCRIPAVASEQINQLPEPVRSWLAHFAFTPIEGLFRPNKDELWLLLSLRDPGRSATAVLWRRLVPIQLVGLADAVHLPEEAIGYRVRLRRLWRYTSYLAARVWHHTRALPPTLWSGAKWAWNRGAAAVPPGRRSS